MNPALPPLRGDEPLSGLGLPPLCNLVYCSRATAGVGEDEVARIVATARQRNPVLGITGLLVFGSGVFFQWLEGPSDNVARLMAMLCADPRHDDIVVLTETDEVHERVFPDWDMERVTSEHIREVLLDAIGAARDEQNATALGRLLEHLEAGPPGRPGTA
jgi:hypothetical protein